MNIALTDLLRQYRRAKASWPFIDDLNASYGLPPYLLYAVASRETNMTNEVGDFGHGHGVFQLDDRSHAIPPGFDADVASQARVAAAMLADNLHRCGSWVGALAAYNSGSCDDSRTTGHDYGKDTWGRRLALEGALGLPRARRGEDNDEAAA